MERCRHGPDETATTPDSVNRKRRYRQPGQGNAAASGGAWWGPGIRGGRTAVRRTGHEVTGGKGSAWEGREGWEERRGGQRKRDGTTAAGDGAERRSGYENRTTRMERTAR